MDASLKQASEAGDERQQQLLDLRGRSDGRLFAVPQEGLPQDPRVPEPAKSAESESSGGVLATQAFVRVLDTKRTQTYGLSSGWELGFLDPWLKVTLVGSLWHKSKSKLSLKSPKLSLGVHRVPPWETPNAWQRPSSAKPFRWN